MSARIFWIDTDEAVGDEGDDGRDDADAEAVVAPADADWRCENCSSNSNCLSSKSDCSSDRLDSL